MFSWTCVLLLFHTTTLNRNRHISSSWKIDLKVWWRFSVNNNFQGWMDGWIGNRRHNYLFLVCGGNKETGFQFWVYIWQIWFLYLTDLNFFLRIAISQFWVYIHFILKSLNCEKNLSSGGNGFIVGTCCFLFLILFQGEELLQIIQLKSELSKWITNWIVNNFIPFWLQICLTDWIERVNLASLDLILNSWEKAQMTDCWNISRENGYKIGMRSIVRLYQ